jgi:hypothetical protein
VNSFTIKNTQISQVLKCSSFNVGFTDTFSHHIRLFGRYHITNSQEEFEETKGVIKIRNRRRTDNTMAKSKWTKGQTMSYKTLHRKLYLVKSN